MIHCSHCKTVNPPEKEICQSCGKSLLPGRGACVRIGVLVVTLAIGAFGVWMLFLRSDNVKIPDLGCALTSPIFWIIVTISVPIMGLVFTLQRTPAHEKYVDRANRHLQLDPQQALTDFNRALQLAPEKAKAEILKSRSKLLLTLGQEQDATRDKIAAMQSEGAYDGAAGFASIVGADKDTFVSGLKSQEQQQLVKSNAAVGLGWCTKCKAVVRLDANMHCSLHPKARITDVRLAVADDAAAEQAAMQESITKRNRSLMVRRIIMIIALLVACVADQLPA